MTVHFVYSASVIKTMGGKIHLNRIKGYDPELDLAALDPEGKPLGLAIIWYNEAM